MPNIKDQPTENRPYNNPDDPRFFIVNLAPFNQLADTFKLFGESIKQLAESMSIPSHLFDDCRDLLKVSRPLKKPVQKDWLSAGDLPDRFEYQAEMRRYWVMLPVRLGRYTISLIVKPIKDFKEHLSHD